VLVRTGSDLGGPARLAGLLLLLGMTMIAATWKFGGPGTGLAFVPGGPGGGSGPNGGGTGRGHRLGNDNWFGGAQVHPPRGPLGTFGVGFADPAPALPETDAEADPDGNLVGRADPDSREASPAALAVTPPSEPPPSEARALLPVRAEVAVDDAVVVQVSVPEVVVPHVVSVRATGALDGAALDAANAGPLNRASHRPSTDRRSSRRFGSR